MVTAFIASLLMAVPADLSRVSVRGTSLVNASGKTLLMRGVNLGGWLVEEPWMTPWKTDPPSGSSEPKATNHVDLWNAVEKHLGHEAMIRIRNAWRDNWITAQDMRLIREDGFDHVRIPFLESILEEPGGLARLHKAVSLASAAGLYVVLDMHGAPGGQSSEDHTGQGKRNRLWFDPENISKMEKTWSTLAQEFKGNEVAMYDLMNEPMGAPNPAMLHIVYDRVVRAIRKVDPDKVLLIEDGYKGFETTPHPNVPGWTNVCFSLHFYSFNAKTPQEHVDTLNKDIPKIKELQGYRQAPMYIGEFNLEPNAGPAVTRQYVDAMAAAGWSWTIWTWKADPVSGTLGQWGVMRRTGAPDPIDPFQDSEESMIDKIKQARTSTFEPIPGLISALVH